MKKKNKQGILLHFIGNNAKGVTGSCIYGECDNGFKFLLECGGCQEGTILENYRNNLNLVNQIKFEEIDIIFIEHSHIDHSMLVPVAITKGFKGRIICTCETKELLYPLWEDCSHIMESDCKYLTTKKGYTIEPFYLLPNVIDTMKYIDVYETSKIHNLTDNISFKLLKNNHILGACQLELYYKDNSSHLHKLLYTSDLGNTVVDKHYVSDIEYAKTANIAIFESTYGKVDRTITKQDRQEDMRNLKETIENTLFNKHGVAVMPCFSMDRSQNIITYLYELFKDDKRFENIPIILDGRLTTKITEVYEKVLNDTDKKKFEEVLNWKNLKIINDYKDTRCVMGYQEPQIILSSSGFATNGHIKEYIKKYIVHKNNTIIFSGYASPSSLSGRLREVGKKYIRIDNGNYKFNCDILVLKSMSSHMQQEQLVSYMKNMNISDEIILVHGDKESRNELKEVATQELSKCDKTTRISIAQKGMKIRF